MIGRVDPCKKITQNAENHVGVVDLRLRLASCSASYSQVGDGVWHSATDPSFLGYIFRAVGFNLCRSSEISGYPRLISPTVSPPVCAFPLSQTIYQVRLRLLNVQRLTSFDTWII